MAMLDLFRVMRPLLLCREEFSRPLILDFCIWLVRSMTCEWLGCDTQAKASGSSARLRPAGPWCLGDALRYSTFTWYEWGIHSCSCKLMGVCVSFYCTNAGQCWLIHVTFHLLVPSPHGVSREESLLNILIHFYTKLCHLHFNTWFEVTS